MQPGWQVWQGREPPEASGRSLAKRAAPASASMAKAKTRAKALKEGLLSASACDMILPSYTRRALRRSSTSESMSAWLTGSPAACFFFSSSTFARMIFSSVLFLSRLGLILAAHSLQ